MIEPYDGPSAFLGIGQQRAQHEQRDREDFARRAAWLLAVARDLSGGPPASQAARLFVAAGLAAALDEGADVLAVLKLRPPRGSRQTARKVLRERASHPDVDSVSNGVPE